MELPALGLTVEVSPIILPNNPPQLLQLDSLPSLDVDDPAFDSSSLSPTFRHEPLSVETFSWSPNVCPGLKVTSRGALCLPDRPLSLSKDLEPRRHRPGGRGVPLLATTFCCKV